MAIHRIYALTSIGRPIDLKYPSNRYMVILLAPSAVLAVLLGLWQGGSWADVLAFALATALAAFGGWALGRELDPDDQVAAFVALVLAVLVMLIMGAGRGGGLFLVLFATLGLVRQVNRTTGLEARLSDSLILLALTLWVMYGTDNPLFGLVAGLSFTLDGSLGKPLRRQWVFAILSFGGTVVYMIDHDLGLSVYSTPDSFPQWLAALVAVVFALNILSTRNVRSESDVSRRPLDPARVRGGMWVSLLAIVVGLSAVEEVALIAATAGGVCIAGAIRRSFRNPT